MSKAYLRVIYGGPAVDDGTMDVRDLSPALMGLGDLCQNANRVLNGGDVSASIRIKADVRKGSFDISLWLVQSLFDHAKGTLYGQETVSANDVLAFLGVVGSSAVGVIQVLKWLKKKPPKNVTTLETGQIRLENIHNSHITIAPQVYQLANARDVRSDLPKIAEPLNRPGIDRFATRALRKQPTVILTKDDLPYIEPDIEPALEETPMLDVVTDAVLEVLRPSFEEKLKWTVTDGKNNYTVDLTDERFKRNVEAGEVDFAAHDALRVKLHTTTRRNQRGALTTDHEITQVLEVIRGPRGHRQGILLESAISQQAIQGNTHSVVLSHDDESDT